MSGQAGEKDATHTILHRFGGEEVVCTCGAYFRTEYMTLVTPNPRTATAKWAEHYRETYVTTPEGTDR